MEVKEQTSAKEDKEITRLQTASPQRARWKKKTMMKAQKTSRLKITLFFKSLWKMCKKLDAIGNSCLKKQIVLKILSA
jgi:hypothetical protein